LSGFAFSITRDVGDSGDDGDLAHYPSPHSSIRILKGLHHSTPGIPPLKIANFGNSGDFGNLALQPSADVPQPDTHPP
jgi:hypothetical protein